MNKRGQGIGIWIIFVPIIAMVIIVGLWAYFEEKELKNTYNIKCLNKKAKLACEERNLYYYSNDYNRIYCKYDPRQDINPIGMPGLLFLPEELEECRK